MWIAIQPFMVGKRYTNPKRQRYEETKLLRNHRQNKINDEMILSVTHTHSHTIQSLH